MNIELRRWKLTRRSTLERTRSESAGDASIEIVNTSKTNLEIPIVDQPECTSLHFKPLRLHSSIYACLFLMETLSSLRFTCVYKFQNWIWTEVVRWMNGSSTISENGSSISPPQIHPNPINHQAFCIWTLPSIKQIKKVIIFPKPIGSGTLFLKILELFGLWFFRVIFQLLSSTPLNVIVHYCTRLRWLKIVITFFTHLILSSFLAFVNHYLSHSSLMLSACWLSLIA